MFTAFPCVAATLATFFFFNDTATTEIYTLSLHDALPKVCFELGLGDLRSGEMLPGPVVFAVHDRQQLVAELVAGQGLHSALHCIAIADSLESAIRWNLSLFKAPKTSSSCSPRCR